MVELVDRPGADRGGVVDRDTQRGHEPEAIPTPEIDPDDRPIAPGLELAGGIRAAQDLRRASTERRFHARPRCRAAVNRAGGLGVLDAISAGALRGGR